MSLRLWNGDVVQFSHLPPAPGPDQTADTGERHEQVRSTTLRAVMSSARSRIGCVTGAELAGALRGRLRAPAFGRVELFGARNTLASSSPDPRETALQADAFQRVVHTEHEATRDSVHRHRKR